MNTSKKKILVGMSGGVDSSVAAALLVEQGYDVTGAYMVNFDSKNDGEYGNKDLDLECWRKDYRDAVRVAAHLGIKLIRLDFTKEYREFVLGYMFDEYEKGRTPNPDVMCNKIVKFDAWVKKAKQLGFDALATGHYATKKHVDQSYALGTAKDENKDQTYFLHQLNQEQLAFAEFPLGELSKEEVRVLAKKFSLPTAEKEESMGICFVGEVPMNEFLQQKISKKPGNIILSSTGEIIGKHEGLTFYTIGQRNIGVESHLPGGDTKPPDETNRCNGCTRPATLPNGLGERCAPARGKELPRASNRSNSANRRAEGRKAETIRQSSEHALPAFREPLYGQAVALEHVEAAALAV